MTIAIIGGGAAGFFAAISAKKMFPKHRVCVFEKSAKVLAKVKISGGGRCNVTNACIDIKKLAAHYPRGEHFLRKAFAQFDTQSTIDWFENRGVPLKTYPDNCIFPASDSSQSIIDCFLKEAAILGVEIELNQSITGLTINNGLFELTTREKMIHANRVIVTTGGQPKRSGLEWLEVIGHEIVEPVPSLFTFNMPNNPIKELMGNVVEKATVKVEGTKLIGKGPLLITHWGMSGPAILQLSAWGARILSDKNYSFAILVNWLDTCGEEELRNRLEGILTDNGAKMIGNYNPFPMTNRLWHFLLEKSGINPEMRWQNLGNKIANKLVNTLLNDRYEVSGKTTFKEEFVTAGGIALKDVDVKTMESKIIPGMFFAGEVLDIDGITGGFNFQAAWTTGFIAGKNVGV
jgi:predicted Rossmann fold flavoprotein